jgi:molybdopterin-containing oxidoreductase family membrane subunit
MNEQLESFTPHEPPATMSGRIMRPILRRGSPLWWWSGLVSALLLLLMFNVAISVLFYYGVGIWGIKVPTAWGFAIVNFVWWIGIGHAGTFISAVLLLVNQKWRTSINRLTEAMTLFAVACAGLFPILHLGRPWVFFWLLPYPNSYDLWPQFRSPLLWDVFAVSTYALVSLMFWYLGLIPDLAALRDRARRRWQQVLFGVMCLGWRGCVSHWSRYQKLYMMLAGLATALVVSVHSIVSLDFAVSIVPGWHSSIFPPYFVAGAIFSGFAMVVTLLVPLRALYGWQDFFTEKHFDNMGKIMLATGLIVTHGYIMETFTSLYSGDIFEVAMMKKRLYGEFAPLYWTLIFCNAFTPQFLWFKAVRRNLVVLWIISIVINIGMWLERYVIVTSSLEKDYLPSAWRGFEGTKWDWMTLAGSFGLFLSLMFLFIRLLPAISMHELNEQRHAMKKEEAA